jgi:hypothetical protein
MTTMSSFEAGTHNLRAIFLGTLAVLAIGSATSALADTDCNSEMVKFKDKRDAAMASINAMVAAAHGKQMDAALFCAKSAPLNTAETGWIAYMEKNKDWCQIPDEIINQLKETHAKSVGFAAKACTVAAQMKKIKEQAAQGGAAGAPQAQPLPAGPL